MNCYTPPTNADPNAFGEFLRDVVFDQEGGDQIGCYTTFKLRPQFYEEQDSCTKDAIILALANAEYNGNPILTFEEIYNDPILNSAKIYTDDDLYVAWYWDGDGVLFFTDTNHNFWLINTDCKKDHGWQLYFPYLNE